MSKGPLTMKLIDFLGALVIVHQAFNHDAYQVSWEGQWTMKINMVLLMSWWSASSGWWPTNSGI